jgi:hypothetical protein
LSEWHGKDAGRVMSSLMDGAFIKRRCYLKLGDGTVMSFVRLRADCFFRHWQFRANGIDEEGYVRATATALHPERYRISEVELRIDPMTSYLVEYRYTEAGVPHVLTLADTEYVEHAPREDGGAT